ncbi:hypothetical protein CRJUMX02_1290088 [Escherichia coli]|nr:hypothetical protein CRJUMX02_1290088 [Escherichia coli]
MLGGCQMAVLLLGSLGAFLSFLLLLVDGR